MLALRRLTLSLFIASRIEMVVYPPKLSRGLALKMALQSSEESDMVEDSEPEREEATRLRKWSRRKPSPSAPNDAPRLTFVDEHVPSPPPPISRSPSVITIDSDSIHPFLSPSQHLRVPEGKNNTPKKLGTTYFPEVIDISCDTLKSETGSIEGGEEFDAPLAGPSNILGISHLAYSKTQQLSRSPSRGSEPCLPAPKLKPVPINGKPPRAKSRTKHLDPLLLQSLDFEKLTRCVFCDTPWTTRKTAAAKVQHVRKCSKSIGASEDQVITQLEAELQNSVSKGQEKQLKARGKKKAEQVVSVTSEPETYLESLVKESKPKKRRQHPPSFLPSSILPVDSMRDTILDRAQQILGGPIGAVEGQIPLEHSSHDQEPLPVDDEPQVMVTQKFAASALLSMYSRPPAPTSGGVVQSISWADCGKSIGLPLEEPAIPRTGPLLATLALFDTSPEPSGSDQPMRYHPTRTSSVVSVSASSPRGKGRAPRQKCNILEPPISSPSVNVPMLQTPPASPTATKRKTSQLAASNKSVNQLELSLEQVTDPEDPWNERSACITWGDLGAEPTQAELSNGLDGDESDIINALQKLTLKHKQTPLTSTPKKRGRPPKTDLEKAVGRKSPKKLCTESSPSKKVSDDEMFQHLRSKIFLNHDLHLRILRYEPIKFDDLLDFARTNGIDPEARGMRRKIRNFLDLACINFYGADIGRN